MGDRVSWPGIDEYVEAYESAHALDGRAEIDEYLPPADHPRRLAILCELIRVDLEYRWERAEPVGLEEYRRRFPELFEDPELAAAVAFEERRLRLHAGEAPAPSEYRGRSGIHGPDRPPASPGPAGRGDEGPPAAGADPDGSDGLRRAADAYRSRRREDPDQDLAMTLGASGAPREFADFFRELHRADPGAADRLARAVTSLPEAGGEFRGFRLESELGRGAFGRVFLARQEALADRPVALKVAADIGGESRAMAQLQHTNVVPIYSTHRVGPLQAICMPYLGSTTLADVLAELRRHETLPDSGAGLLSTLEGRHRRGASPADKADGSVGPTHRIDSGPEESGAPTPPAPHIAVPTAQLERLRGLRYTSAVLWLGARLADGLAHAHERGILHRDLKPANILFADDGEPMLLDFNLAADTKLQVRASAALVGGTLPYMAPEQLSAYRDGSPFADARGDIYALGVILFELLTGRHPFEIRRGPIGVILPEMIADRSGPPPRLRPINSSVTPAVEAIVRRCLEPDPARRYPTARQLREDLQRQLEDLPLKHTPEPSLRERMRKWARRHPRLTSSSSIALASAFVVLLLFGLGLSQKRRLQRLEATDSLHRLDGELKRADALLGSRDGPPGQIAEGQRLCRDVVERYGLLDDARPWTEGALVAALDDDERGRLRGDLGELMFLWARAALWSADAATDRAARREAVSEALRLNAAAEACFRTDATPRAVALQRADLLQLDGREVESRALRERAEHIPLRSPRERLMLVSDRLDRRRFGEALDHFRALLRGAPQNFALWLLTGNAHAGLGQFDDAINCYSVAIALQPNLHWSHFNRGLLALDHKDDRQALEDFDKVLELRPGLTEALINRAIARLRLDDPKGALADLDRALEDPGAPTRALFIRATVHQRLGEPDAARKVHEEGLRREPRDEVSWRVRGEQRIANDPQGALADFTAALRLNPRSSETLRDLSYLLAERLGRTDEAIRALGDAIEIHSDSAPLLAGRGVLRARLGRRDQAHEDARAALAARPEPEQVYQAACIYALTSLLEPADRSEALRLLAEAIRQDPKWLGVIPKDHDLDPIRQAPEFVELMTALRVVHRDFAGVGPK